MDILYVRDLVKPGLVEEVEKNLDSYVIDHVGDSGVLEQFAEAMVFTVPTASDHKAAGRGGKWRSWRGGWWCCAIIHR